MSIGKGIVKDSLSSWLLSYREAFKLKFNIQSEYEKYGLYVEKEKCRSQIERSTSYPHPQSSCWQCNDNVQSWMRWDAFKKYSQSEYEKYRNREI